MYQAVFGVCSVRFGYMGISQIRDLDLAMDGRLWGRKRAGQRPRALKEGDNSDARIQ